MGASDEDWYEQDLEMLLDVATPSIDESLRCHQAGCPRAALMMLATAFEAVLLGMVIAHEDKLRAAGQWPKQPSRKHLAELAVLARNAGWLSGQAVDEVVRVLNTARTMAAHPGAYVRGLRQAPDLALEDPVGYQVMYEIVVQACQELAAALPTA